MKINIPSKLLSSLLPEKVYYNEPMSNHTAIGTGGYAAALLLPDTLNEICLIIRELQGTKFFVVGNGGNLLVSDRGYNGIVIKTTNVRKIERFGCYITALAGDTLQDISERALGSSLTGMEWAAADAGTLGGAISTNAAHFGAEIRNNIYVVEVINKAGNILTLKESELNMRPQKTDVAQKGYTVLRAMLRLDKGRAALSKKHMDAYRKASEIEQEKPSIGEVFSALGENDLIDIGELIKESGCAGISVGGVSLSSKNPNYIVNNGGATTDDAIKLINDITTGVYSKTGVLLKHNLKTLGKL